jgi:hypothetical protein
MREFHESRWMFSRLFVFASLYCRRMLFGDFSFNKGDAGIVGTRERKKKKLD